VTGNLRLAKREESGIEPITESSLSGHLSNPDDENASEGEAAVADETTLAEDDYQLNEALNLLKGLTILSRQG
jgi:carboxyl-terminal processing protease